MSWIVFIVLLLLQGLLVGAFARLALPGRDPLTIGQTILVGMAGSFVAGVLVYIATDGSAAPGFLSALVAATVIMYFVRRSRGGGLTDPGVPGSGRRPRA
jgi:uncharacterized membrane protein YeaQ/YmgE (transglycosylase-associated protein family)